MSDEIFREEKERIINRRSVLLGAVRWQRRQR